jgi:hypothetical protein
VFVTDAAWQATLRGIGRALEPTGNLVFEVRDPARQAWLDWTPAATRSTTEVAGVGPVGSWVEVLVAIEPLVTFRWTYRFHRTGDVLTSDSTPRFRSEAEIRASLAEAGYSVLDASDAPDRPGQEFVFLARLR